MLLLLVSCLPALGNENPRAVLFLLFPTQADLPVDDGFGSGTLITNGIVPHGGIAAVGVQLRYTEESHFRERWTVQWFNDAGALVSSDALTYNRDGYCWQYVCGLGTLYTTWRSFTSFLSPDCSMHLAHGWKWRLLWEYADTLNADFNAGLSTPVVVQEQNFDIGVSRGALQITSDKTIVHPASVHSTGGTTYPRFSGGVAHITFLAKDCGQIPPRPVRVTMTPTVVSHSAGHNHNSPPVDELASFDSMTCTTDSRTGACTITMTGEGVSSFLKLRAHIDDFDTTDSVVSPVDSDEYNMVVAIPGLQEMAFDTSIVFPSGITTTHPQNHFAQPEMISFIYLFAKKYQDTHNGDRIRIDDMSLPLGGNFDIDADYDADRHAFHRFGVDVDVSQHIIDSNGTQVNLALNVGDLTTYIEVFLHGSRWPEGPIHYRFPANGIDEIVRTRIQP